MNGHADLAPSADRLARLLPAIGDDRLGGPTPDEGRTVGQLRASAAIGATMMVLADWIGRIVIYPWEVPAGIIAAFAGGAYLAALIGRGRR